MYVCDALAGRDIMQTRTLRVNTATHLSLGFFADEVALATMLVRVLTSRSQLLALLRLYKLDYKLDVRRVRLCFLAKVATGAFTFLHTRKYKFAQRYNTTIARGEW